MEKDLVDRDIVPVAHAPDHRGDKEREHEEKNGRDNDADDAGLFDLFFAAFNRSNDSILWKIQINIPML